MPFRVEPRSTTASKPADQRAHGRERRLAGEVASNLRELDVAEPMSSVAPCVRLARDAATMGRLRLVVADRTR